MYVYPSGLSSSEQILAIILLQPIPILDDILISSLIYCLIFYPRNILPSGEFMPFLSK